MSGVSAGPRDVRRLPYGGAIFRARTHAVANRSEVAIDTLTSSQRARLKALAHPLKPILHIGREGVTPHALDAVRQAFNTREILKVKVLDTAPADARSTAEELVHGIPHAHLVQIIGRTAVLYRPDPDRREIDLS